MSAGAKDADTIRLLEDELEAGQTKCHALNPRERAAAGVAVQRASGVSQSEQAGEASKKQLPESEGTADDCKKRCDEPCCD